MRCQHYSRKKREGGGGLTDLAKTPLEGCTPYSSPSTSFDKSGDEIQGCKKVTEIIYGKSLDILCSTVITESAASIESTLNKS